MKAILLISLFLMAISIANGQNQMMLKGSEIETQIHIASNEIHKSFIHAPAKSMNLKSATNQKAIIEVEYINFPEEAKHAFEYAVSIWADLISSSLPIRIQAEWSETMNINSMAAAKPTSFYLSNGENFIQNVLYPVSLIEKISGKEVNNREPDIVCSFNKNIPWYFGTDGNTPVSRYDFTTAVLHEIAHGLGFAGFMKIENGKGIINNTMCLPSIYDYYLFNNTNQQIVNNSIFPNSSINLAFQLTSNELQFFCADNKYGNETTVDRVLAPSEWKDGVSIYHLDNSANEVDQLMGAFAKKGEAIHNPGDVTLEILSEMGWNTVSFEFEKPVDVEDNCNSVSLELNVKSELSVDFADVYAFYSNNEFATRDSIKMNFNANTNKFEVILPIKSGASQVQYYFSLNTNDEKVFCFPKSAPEKLFVVNIGTDNMPPVLKHNPVKMIAKSSPFINLSAIVNDNVGVNSVKIEYKIDGALQKSILLTNDSADFFKTKFELPAQISEKSKVEYRVIAEDKSTKKNIKTSPALGFYSVEIFSTQNPVTSYQTDFNSASNDFVSNDFVVSREPGFYSGILQTIHPYPLSAIEDQKYNLVTQLSYPIILQNNGIMSFSEVVLVEPSLPATCSTSQIFWDFVVVEGSKDNGETWIAFNSAYDSQLEGGWATMFNGSLANGCSKGVAEESMLKEHVIALTDGENFAAGDTVLIRFRLASDQTINGWGWAIDNLKIQTLSTASSDLTATNDYNVYPNPFTSSLSIDCSGISNDSDVEIIVNDLMGRNVYRENWYNSASNVKKQIDLTELRSGVYLLSLSENNTSKLTKKIIKK